MDTPHTKYTHPVAKVMISLPDELLARVDAEADRRALSRSAVLRDFARAALDDDARLLADGMRELSGQATGHGGRSLEILKASRPG